MDDHVNETPDVAAAARAVGRVESAKTLETLYGSDPEVEPVEVEAAPKTADDTDDGDELTYLRKDSETLIRQRVQSLQQRAEAAQQGYQQYAALIQQAEKEADAETDRERRAAIKADIRSARERLEQLRQQAATEFDKETAELVRDYEGRYSRRKAAELKRLPSDFPKAEVKAYAERHGIPSSAIQTAAQAMILFRAMKQEQAESGQPQAKKYKLPPGARKPKPKQQPERELSRIEQKNADLAAMYGTTTRRRSTVRPRPKDDPISILYPDVVSRT